MTKQCTDCTHNMVCRIIGRVELNNEECKLKRGEDEKRGFAVKEGVNIVSAPSFTMQCSKCGTYGFGGDTYCAKCGRKFE